MEIAIYNRRKFGLGDEYMGRAGVRFGSRDGEINPEFSGNRMS